MAQEALASTKDWLATPERWELEAGEPGTSDKKLARLQFGTSLLAATDAGVMNDRPLLRQTAAALAADQDPDGAWRIAQQTSLGSPVAYGPSVATWLAQRVLLAADPGRFAAQTTKAEAYFVASPAHNVMDAAAAALALAHAESKAARERRQEALGWLAAAQTADGGWGPYKGSAPEAFDTALALLALAQAGGDPYRDAVRKGRELPDAHAARGRRLEGNHAAPRLPELRPAHLDDGMGDAGPPRDAAGERARAYSIWKRRFAVTSRKRSSTRSNTSTSKARPSELPARSSRIVAARSV